MKYGAHDQDGRAGECKTLPPSMSQSKIHVHAEQYSLKTANSWRLTESLLRTQGCQIATWCFIGRKDKHQVGICASGRGLSEEGRLQGQRTSLGG